MACVPPRAGSNTTLPFPIAQGVALSRHGKMKQILAGSCLWHKSGRGWLPVWNVRDIVSQVVVEEIESSEGSGASEKKTMHWQRWKAHETMVLIAAKKQQELRCVESTEAAGFESKKIKNKWKEIEVICQEKGIERSAQQCQTRWFRLMSVFTQIRSWEETRKPEQPSFWSLNLDERKTMGFLSSLDQNIYNALHELYNIKADAIENTLVQSNVEVVELGSMNTVSYGYDGKNCITDKADENGGCVEGVAHKVNNKANSLTSGYKIDEMVQAECLDINKPICEENVEKFVRVAEDNFTCEELEEHKLEKQANWSKARESTTILSKCLQVVLDDSNEAQLLPVDAGKINCNPLNLRTSQHEESLKFSKHKNVPASAELIVASNKDLCQGSLVVVHDSNKAQLLDASAGKVNCNPMNHQTCQFAESSKVHNIAEHINPSVCCDQKDSNVKSQLLPASVEMIHGSNKDSCRGSLEEHGAEENTAVMHWDYDNNQLLNSIHDGTMQAHKGNDTEKNADGSSLRTESRAVKGLANAYYDSASVESYECQKSDIHFASTEVDVLHANQSAPSCISIDKQDCRYLSEVRSSAEEVCIDKTEKEFSEVREGKYKNADILTAWVNSDQSNYVEARNKNDASETVDGMVAESENFVPIVQEAYARSEMVLHDARPEQQQGGLNPLLASTEEISTGVLKEVPKDNSQFLTSEIFESICSAQEQGSEKIEELPFEEGHAEVIADMVEGSSTVSECSNISFEEKKVENLGHGNNEYSEKTSVTSHNIQHFEVGVKIADSYSKREPHDQFQSMYEKDRSDPMERMKVGIKEGEYLTEKIEIRGSTVDANSPALMCIQHPMEQKNTIKGDGGSFKDACEVKKVEVLEMAAKELESIIKDDRGSPVTSGKGSTEDQSQKTITSSKADDDVLLYIPAATGNLLRSAVETIRKFFKF